MTQRRMKIRLGLTGAAMVLVCVSTLCEAQTSMAPFKTPQMNQNLYVGQSGYATIQSAVTFACKTGNKTYAVIIPAGAAPTDSIAAVTGGCATTYVVDNRNASATNSTNYGWNGTNYIQQPMTAPAINITGTQRGPNPFPLANSARIDYITPDNTARLYGFGPDANTVSNVQLIGYASDGIKAAAYMTCQYSTNTCYITGPNLLVQNSPVCTQATGCPGASGGMVYPPAGLANSTGTAWGTSINPATLPTLAGTNAFTGANTFTRNLTAGTYISARGVMSTPVAGSAVIDILGNGALRLYGVNTTATPSQVQVLGSNSDNSVSQVYFTCSPNATGCAFNVPISAPTVFEKASTQTLDSRRAGKCKKGEMWLDGEYFYGCSADNQPRRVLMEKITK